MYLFKVTIFCKKQWMEKYNELSWACIADTGQGAIEQILDEFDLDGVEIQKTKAEKIDNGIIAII